MSTKIDRVKYLKTIGICNNGFNGRGFANPYSVSVASNGNIYVVNRCDTTRRPAIRIGIFNIEEEYIGEFGSGGGSKDGQFMLPVAIAFDKQDRLHVTDEYLHRVSVFDLSGKFLFKWGNKGSGDGDFNGPSGIAFDSNDNAFVADQFNHRIQKYDSSGNFVLQWGDKGNDIGQFNMPWGIGVDKEDNIYIADWRNDRVQKFDNEGKFIMMFGSQDNRINPITRPSAVVVDDVGDVYISDWGNERIQIFDQTGDLVQILNGEATLSKWAKDFFDSNPDEWEHRINSNLTPELPDHLNKSRYQISSQTEPYFWGPVGLDIDAMGYLYVVESNRHRVQIYTTRS